MIGAEEAMRRLVLGAAAISGGGQIHEIEAKGVGLPYGTKSGWD